MSDFIYNPKKHPWAWKGLKGQPILIDGYYVLVPYANAQTNRQDLEHKARCAIQRCHDVGLDENVRCKRVTI